jgi:hypothetical protein
MPERAAVGRRAVLLFGNSQLHDGDWRFPGALAVNCARQGMTLRAGLAAANRLPDVAPAVVIVGFGAVEALQAASRGAAVDADAVARDMGTLLGHLRARWPEADLIILAVPPMRPALLPAARRNAARIGAINDAIARAAGAALLATMTYDGVHLTEAAYALLQAQIIAASANLKTEPPPVLLCGLDPILLAVKRPGFLQHHALLDAAAAGLGGDGVRDMRQHARVDLAGARAGFAPAAALGGAVDEAVLFTRGIGLVDGIRIRGLGAAAQGAQIDGEGLGVFGHRAASGAMAALRRA